MYAPTTIDLSGVPAPTALEALSFETLHQGFLTRFKERWAALRQANPGLPDYDVAVLETDPVAVISQAYAYTRLLDRARINDALRAVLAPLAKGSDLDNIVARIGLARLILTPARDLHPAVMETDEALLRRYLLAFDRPAAGSSDAYIFHTLTAVPSLLDVAVIGQSVHGRKGDVDIVLIGEGGRAPLSTEIANVYAACTASHIKPEATSVSVVPAKRATFNAELILDVPRGPDPSALESEARSRIYTAMSQRMLIGAEVPLDAISGAAYGKNILRVTRISPGDDILADPYTVPVMSGLTLHVYVRG